MIRWQNNGVKNHVLPIIAPLVGRTADLAVSCPTPSPIEKQNALAYGHQSGKNTQLLSNMIPAGA